ncbi:N,N-dimethylformamidase beta subunit family domain-containing protein [Pimelobacter simplex]|uniref:N,N-dimethylformamidase beta subunit family domain-containing protein n=1 Tax=Nocardioides simplex TaxID=2045 RepID=UPI0021502CD7|nr:N,N-dimethylformamidase beta subunit family domain-containing protein [Pimelobacter simplex]UUW90851.1 hypothetical protein M0M43_05010 [Pimelobacter simplex]UUW94680.1 hypothetical protein M0M48_23515 [Pimelobacter simplex]
MSTARYAWSIPGFPVERPGADPTTPEIWCYADRFSYLPGDEVGLSVHTTAPTYDVRVVRDGADPVEVWSARDQPGVAHPTPDDAYAVGCGWPVALRIPVDPTWDSGFYLVVVGVEADGRRHEREGFFVVRAPEPRAELALVLTTGTLTAYNDWGGANHYRGLGDDPYADIPAPVLSNRRPVARGMLRLPDGAPRNANPATPGPGYRPRHPTYEWAITHGYTRHHSDAFWATYERPFVGWAERQGYRFDYLTQQDLHDDPTALDGYRGAVLVGHDEYWTWEMRDVVDRFVDGGGGLARFAGNYVWQVRLDDEQRQTCYKDPRLDPMMATDPTRVTTTWDAPFIDRPGTATMGLTGLGGAYARYGATTPRSSGGYTVYRPEHWALAGTDLYYGDVFGAAPVCVAAFEVDGVDYTFRHGLPYATGTDGAPEDLTIVALTPAVLGETDRWDGEVPIGAPLAEMHDLLGAVWGDDVPERFASGYGAGMVATFRRGAGEVFNAGTTEWVSGLIHHDPFTEQITHNVLRRFGAAAHLDHPVPEESA